MVTMSGRLSGLATGLLCGTVVAATLALPPTSASAEGSPRTTSAQADKAKPKPPPRTIRGTLGKVPDLSLDGQLISGARPGGRGIFDVVLASTTPGGKSIRGLETRIEAPRGTALTRVSGKDWTCAVAPGRRAADCSLTRALGRDETAPHIRAHLAVSASYTSSKAWITGYARWKGAERVEGNWVLSERNDLPVYPKATLALTPSAPEVTVFRNGSSDQRRFQLLAEIGRLQGQHAELQWRQYGNKTQSSHPTLAICDAFIDTLPKRPKRRSLWARHLFIALLNQQQEIASPEFLEQELERLFTFARKQALQPACQIGERGLTAELDAALDPHTQTLQFR